MRDLGILQIPEEHVHVIDGQFAWTPALGRYLNQMAGWMVQRMGTGDRVRKRLVVGQEWTITNELEKVREYPLPHVCDDCLDGIEQAHRALLADPGVWIALCTVTYEEHIYEQGEPWD